MNALSNLSGLNSATKYPQILTYHELGDKGRLNDVVTAFDGPVYFTEKIDGTNGRIVFLPGGDYVIGSREHLLHARGDRIVNPTQEIAPTLKSLADRLASAGWGVKSGARVLYLEVYGGNVTAQSKQYTGSGNLSYRLFDIAEIGQEPMTWDDEVISGWRKGGGQNFASVTELLAIAKGYSIPTVPYVGHTPDGSEMPKTLQETYDFLGRIIPVTSAGLDDGAKGSPEGIVFRSESRSVIRKARFGDYRRTLKIK